MFAISDNFAQQFKAVRILRATLMFCIVASATFSWSRSLHAAGCHLGVVSNTETESYRQQILPKWSWWAEGRVVTLYDGGDFDYFHAIEGLPSCNGPECRGSDSDQQLDVVSFNTAQRLPQLASPIGTELMHSPPSKSRIRSRDEHPYSSFLPGLLRPPR